MEDKQRALLREAMGGQVFDALQAQGPMAMATESMMGMFTPLFTQFLAWQRLMTMNQHMIDMAEHLPTPVAGPSRAGAKAARASAETAAQAMATLPKGTGGWTSAESLYQSFYEAPYAPPAGNFTPEAFAEEAELKHILGMKRKRSPLADVQLSAEEDGPEPPRRKPGRPRKKKAAKPYKPTGRPRGRPRKNRPPEPMDESPDSPPAAAGASFAKGGEEEGELGEDVAKVHLTAYIWSEVPEVQLPSPVRFEFPNVLPLQVGRCADVDAGNMDLHLNMCWLSNCALVRKVSHHHVSVQGVLNDPNSLFVECRGRNGMLVNGVNFRANQQARLDQNDTNLRVGPFAMKLVVSMETAEQTAERQQRDLAKFGDVNVYPVEASVE